MCVLATKWPYRANGNNKPSNTMLKVKTEGKTLNIYTKLGSGAGVREPRE
jgi:hypothetical protein